MTIRWQLEEVPIRLQDEIEYLDSLFEDLFGRDSERVIDQSVIMWRFTRLNLNKVWLKYIAVGAELPAKENLQKNIAGWIDVIADLLSIYASLAGADKKK